jgi:flagellar biosynthesis protein FliR
MSIFETLLSTIVLVTLRIAPTLAYAPPFTLLRIPLAIRLALALGLGTILVLSNPAATTERFAATNDIFGIVIRELFLGISLAISLQIAFAAILTVGRTIDIQAGFGLALLADPNLKSQMPLVGTLFAYAAGAIFFTTTGPSDLISIWSNSLQNTPLGTFTGLADIGQLSNHMTACFSVAFGLAGLILLVLFLMDLGVAFLSKTLPQMNVLLLSFQVKTLALLATLPITFVLSGALFLRILRTAIDATGSVR